MRTEKKEITKATKDLCVDIITMCEEQNLSLAEILGVLAVISHNLHEYFHEVVNQE